MAIKFKFLENRIYAENKANGLLYDKDEIIYKMQELNESEKLQTFTRYEFNPGKVFYEVRLKPGLSKENLRLYLSASDLGPNSYDSKLNQISNNVVRLKKVNRKNRVIIGALAVVLTSSLAYGFVKTLEADELYQKTVVDKLSSERDQYRMEEELPPIGEDGIVYNTWDDYFAAHSTETTHKTK